MTAQDWDLLQARWHRASQGVATDAADVLVLDKVGEVEALTLAPGVASHRAGWSRFRLRHRYPTTPAPDLRDARHLLVVRVVADAPERSDFRRWLDEEHCRLQVSLPGVHWYLGYEEEGDRHSFLNLWSVDEPETVDGADWARVRETPWWARLSHIPEGAYRGVFRPR